MTTVPPDTDGAGHPGTAAEGPRTGALGRRALFTRAGVAAAGAALAGCARAPGTSGTAVSGDAPANPRPVVATGPHQAGITTTPASFARLVAFDLIPGAGRDNLRRLMRIWSDDVVRMAAARPILTDVEPEIARQPAALTFTVGFGPDVFDIIGQPDQRPGWLAELPPFTVDRLEPAWCGGDLLLQVCADDPLVLAHAVRLMAREASTFASIRWVQNGFRHREASLQPSRTMRNLMGQLDGTRNVDPDVDPSLVWVGEDGPAWLAGGTSMVVRRIVMDLTRWDSLDRAGQEAAIGRRLDTGAPLTGHRERDEPDLNATDALGLPVIDTFAHIRRARTDDPTQRFLRRGYNFDDPPAPGVSGSSGLVFITFQADPVRQFVPIQRRLDELDLLNTWTTPVGSAVFAIPAGFTPPGYLAQDLLG